MAREAVTVGHSTHPADRLLDLLAGAAVELVADVRRFPGSRRLPHVAAEPLAAALAGRGIGYLHLPELGGRRRPVPESPNGGWRVEAFRGYADHMASAEFAAGLARLEAEACARRTAVMCAEAQWWRCHRRLVADALVARGWAVEHLGGDGRLTSHELTEFAVAGPGGELRYPAPQVAFDL
jgi:uncharacterized protein (DUF488 family)